MLALFGIIGLGVGALLRNQIVAVTVGVIFLLILQNILLAIPGCATPGRTCRPAPSCRSFQQGRRPGRHRHASCSPLGGVIVLLLWAFVPAIIGAGFTMNRDIT